MNELKLQQYAIYKRTARDNSVYDEALSKEQFMITTDDEFNGLIKELEDYKGATKFEARDYDPSVELEVVSINEGDLYPFDGELHNEIKGR